MDESTCTGGAIPKKFSRNVLLLKNGDFTRIDYQVYMPTASEISKLKHSVQLGQFKRKVEFDASMSEDLIKNKLEETFPYLENRRFSCAAVVKVDQDSARFEFHGSPRIWSGNEIRSKIKGNSALYILENEALNSETETSTSIPQGDNDDMNSLATVVNQISLVDDSQMMEIEESQQVTPGDENATTVESGHISMRQDQLQMSDSSEGILSPFDNATSSGIGGEFSEEEFNGMAQWAQNNVDYEVCINPQESPLQGGAPCLFYFNPLLQPEVTSGHAKFGNTAPVKLKRLDDDSLLGTIPASQVLGWVPVIIESQDDKRLGQTTIKYHGDQMEEALQQIVVDPSLQKRLFYKYKLYCSSGGNPETSGGEAQNSATPGFTQPVQMLSLLVYAAAESGAQQFIEMIFTSSAGRVVYDAYKDRPLLPEVIAKKHGNEETANYLQEITKRFSEEIRTGQECSHIIDWSELVKAAEAAQKQLGLTSEENYQLESDVPKETGYLGDAETSPSESSAQSSDSDDDISTTFRKVMADGQVPSPEEKLDFDDDTIRVIAKVYFEEGNKEYRKKETYNAIYFYTEGIKVNCKDVQLNAKLYSNRATAYFYLGNYQEALNDAKAAVKLEPTFIEAITIGVMACVQLQFYEEVITWCDKGLVIVKNNKPLLDFWTRCVGELVTWEETKRQEMKNKSDTHSMKGQFLLYCNFGNAYQSLGDFKTAIIYHKRCLEIAKEVGDKAGEGKSYCNLGNAYHSLGDFKKAIDYHKQCLEIAKEVGDKAGEGRVYGNLGCTYQSLGDFETAIDYHERCRKIAKEVEDKAGEGKSNCHLGCSYQGLKDFKTAINYHKRCLKIAKEVGDKVREGRVNGNLGCSYHSLGDFETAIDYHERCLKIAKELEDKAGEGKSYCNLGNTYHSLGDFKTAINYYERCLEIAKEVEDKAGEGKSYCHLGNIYHSLKDFKTAIGYHERCLKIAKEVGDKAREGKVYGNLGFASHSLGDFETAIDYYERCLKIAKEVEDRAEQAISFYQLGRCFESEGSLLRALDYFHSSVAMLNDVRGLLQLKYEWKISYRDMLKGAYTSLWHLLLKQGKVHEALFTAAEGRAQALNDLLELNYGSGKAYFESHKPEKNTCDTSSFLPSNTVFIAVDKREIIFWFIQNGKNVQLRRKEICDHGSEDDVTTFLQSLIQEIGARAGVQCENRSFEKQSVEKLANERSSKQRPYTVPFQTNALKTLYDIIIAPIADLVHDNELVIVPEGPLCLAPYAAFKDPNSRYLCESFRIRVIPSLTSLALIKGCPPDYPNKTGVLLVGDLCLKEVLYQGIDLNQLPWARKEVEMIGRILHTTPLTGEEATKDEVLKRLSSVALVHIAARRMDTGEIALAPNTTDESKTPVEQDFILTLRDLLSVKMRASLVVLSCCHSGGIKGEGIVGIARAFLGAGARSVLVSLWPIDDEATLEFMKSFYKHLVRGRSAGESLNQAMKCMRESDEFSDVRHWAPFVLIGDDITLDFDALS